MTVKSATDVSELLSNAAKEHAARMIYGATSNGTPEQKANAIKMLRISCIEILGSICFNDGIHFPDTEDVSAYDPTLSLESIDDVKKNIKASVDEQQAEYYAGEMEYVDVGFEDKKTKKAAKSPRKPATKKARKK